MCVGVRMYVFMYMSMHICYLYIFVCDNGTDCLLLLCMLVCTLEWPMQPAQTIS